MLQSESESSRKGRVGPEQEHSSVSDLLWLQTRLSLSRGNMADSGSLREQCQCCICLELFTLPVTVPCGHNFCKRCITQAWDVSSKNQCPLCKELFGIRPELRVNTTLSEMCVELRRSVSLPRTRTGTGTSGSEEPEGSEAGPGDVACDVCVETKRRAVKSCLVCVASYCEVHLEPHHRILGLKKHTLMEPVQDVQDRSCTRHERPLELFCRTDQSFLCPQCVPTDHRRHILVPLKKEYEQKKATLDQNLDDIEQKISVRREKVSQLEQSVTLSRDEASRETSESIRVFTALTQTAERVLSQLLETIEARQKSAENRAQRLMTELKLEMDELTRTKTELERLSQTEDPLYFLKNFKTKAPEETKDWGEVRVQASFEGTLRSAVARLEEEVSSELKRLTAAELRSVQMFSVDVSLDPDTAHAALLLSDDRKQVRCGDAKQNLPDTPLRFSDSPCVLASQRFVSGKSYYEVQVKDKTKWYLGVAKDSINRKGQIAASPATGLWAVWLKNGPEYRALDEPAVPLQLRTRPQKVGVFVDYDEGLVSFYDADSSDRIYSFSGFKFTEELRPFFGPCTNDGGRNSAALQISPVNPTSGSD